MFLAECKGDANLVTSSPHGTISFASGEYINSVNCKWLIDAGSDDSLNRGSSFIALFFESFGTEPGKDILRIYDGKTIHSPILGSFSGYEIPHNQPLVASGSTVLLHFSSNDEQRGPQPGLKLKYQVFDGAFDSKISAARGYIRLRGRITCWEARVAEDCNNCHSYGLLPRKDGSYYGQGCGRGINFLNCK